MSLTIAEVQVGRAFDGLLARARRRAMLGPAGTANFGISLIKKFIHEYIVVITEI